VAKSKRKPRPKTRRKPPRRNRRPKAHPHKSGPDPWSPKKADARLACKAIERGWSIESVARPYLGCSPTTLFKWLKANPTSEFAKSIEEAKYIDVGDTEEDLKRQSKKDFRATRFKLMNRAPLSWRDKQDPDAEEGDAVPVGGYVKLGTVQQLLKDLAAKRAAKDS